jgi:hypothetical protein
MAPSKLSLVRPVSTSMDVVWLYLHDDWLLTSGDASGTDGTHDGEYSLSRSLDVDHEHHQLKISVIKELF